MEKPVSNEKLAYYQEFLEIIPMFFQEDVSVALADTKTLLMCG